MTAKEIVRYACVASLATTAALLAISILTRSPANVATAGINGPSFVELPGGKVSSAVRVTLENESTAPRHYTINVRAPDATLRSPRVVWEVKPESSLVLKLRVEVPRGSFSRGQRRIDVYIDDNAGFHRIAREVLRGPQD